MSLFTHHVMSVHASVFLDLIKEVSQWRPARCIASGPLYGLGFSLSASLLPVCSNTDWMLARRMMAEPWLLDLCLFVAFSCRDMPYDR